MSVIIRLQNLPWSANAADIREFFKGLLIPEGGVHIVGGEEGDAFIAFGSDEDARLAMRKSNGILKGIQVSLLLSSRSEMQKVIETARQQAMAQQQGFGAPAVAAPTQAPNPAAQQQPATPAPAAYSAMQQPQMPQYAGMNTYYSGAMYGKQGADTPKPAETFAPAAAPLNTPFGYNSSVELMSQNWRNGFGKADPSAIPGADAAYNVAGNKPQYNNAYPYNSNDQKVSSYGMQSQQPPTITIPEEYDEKELYQQALRASKKPEASRLDEAPNSSVGNAVYSNTSGAAIVDAARYSSAEGRQPGSMMAPAANNQSPRRHEQSVERKEASKDEDKLREKDKYGRDEWDRDTRRRRSKSRSRSRDRDRRRRHRSRSRSRDRTSRRRRSRSKERQERSRDRDRDRDKSRSSGTSRDHNERRSSDDKPSNDSVAAASPFPVVLSKNSGATLPGLGEIPQELPKSLPNAILGMPPSQEIITSDMYSPSVSGGAWGVDPKLKNAQSAAKQPPVVDTTPSNVRDPRMQASASSAPAVQPSEPRTDRWGIPIPETSRELNQRTSNDGNASPAGPPSGQNRHNVDPNFGRDMNLFPRQPDNWDNHERPERNVHPDTLSGHRHDLPPERPRGYVENTRDPRSAQHVTRSPDVGPRVETQAERSSGPGQSRWSSPHGEQRNSYSREPRGPRMGEPDYPEHPPRRMEAQRAGGGMEGHRQSLERYPDNRGMPGRPRDDRMWESDMSERYPHARDKFPPGPDMDDPRMDSPGPHNMPFESGGRGMRGRGGFDPRGRGGRRRGFGRAEDQYFPDDAEPERFRGGSFPNEYPPFDEGPRGSPSGPGPYRGRGGGGGRGRGGYSRTGSPARDRPPTCSVELLNLPPSANYRAIRESFYGVYVPRDSIKLLGDENGVKIGVGLIRFNSQEDAIEASQRDGIFIHDCKIQIRLIDEEVYDKHEDFRALRHLPSFEAAPVNFIPSEWVHIMGMPPGKTEDDVAAIFSNSYVNDILREVYPNSKKATGGFFMRLSCPDEAHVLINESQGFDVEGSLLHLRQAMHDEIEQCTVKLAERHLIEDADGHPDERPPLRGDFDNRHDGMPRSNPGPGKPLNNAGQHPPASNPGRKTVLLATPSVQPDLRESLSQGNGEGKRPLDNTSEAPSRKRAAIDEDLLTDSVVVHDVQMGTTHNNVVDFFSDDGPVPEHVHFVPYDPKVGGRVFVIFPRVSHARKAIKKSGQKLGPSAVRIELIAKPEVMSAMGLPFNPLELIKKSDHAEEERPEAAPRAARGPLLETPGAGPARGSAGARGSPVRSNSSTGPGPKQGEIIPEQFGQPGCVVALSNLPFNATTEDILMFLSREFPRVSPEHVIRRYNEHNQPTSDARVSFQTPDDAQKCVRTLNRKIIFNRVITITLVES